ncbi:hypothetical protein N9795_01460 [Candidatus Pelagibacter sp.]|nr:hypothetical protein [Candidatus Pelagibacter sp.]
MISINKLFEEAQPKINYTIYCDMDGCLCDFEARFEHFTGLSPDEYRKEISQKYGEKQVNKMFWDLIDKQIGVRFWRGIPWMPGGQQLWNYIKPHNPTLLSSPSFDDSSRMGKSLWVKDHIPGTPLIFRQAKQKSDFAGPNKILIDDREDTIMNWKAKNGIGILYKNTDQTINDLKKLGI